MSRLVQSDTGPWAPVPLWIVPALMAKKPRAGGTALLVYVTMSKWADNDTQDCWPSHASIAKECGEVTVETVKSALKLLREVGAISWRATTKDDGSPGSNMYTILRAMPTNLSQVGNGRGGRGGGTNLATNHTHLELDPTNYANESDMTSRADQLEGELTLAIEAFEEPQARAVAKRASRKRPTDDPIFDRFWSVWPGGGSTVASRKAWNAAVKRDGVEAIREGFKPWSAYWTRMQTERIYIPYASTWLNQARYLELPPNMPSGGGQVQTSRWPTPDTSEGEAGL